MGDGQLIETPASGDEGSTPGDPSKSEQDKRARIRDNQRRSRARRQEHLLDLERRLAECHTTCREAELQRDAFKQLQIENGRLRELLRVVGVNDALVNSYVNHSNSQSMDSSTSLRQIRPRIAMRDEVQHHPDHPLPYSDSSSLRRFPSNFESVPNNMAQISRTQARNLPATPRMQLDAATPSEQTSQQQQQHGIFLGSMQSDESFHCNTFDISPAHSVLPSNENTIPCSVAKEILQEYNVDPIDMDWVKARLATGFFKPALPGQGCSVDNQLLFQILNEINPRAP